jgi:arginyl-tRNA synthetase
MKITVNEVKEIPGNFGEGVCVYGQPNEKIQAWIDYHGFETTQSGPYTNIILHEEMELDEYFESFKPYAYVDGFSPNLNKHLHLGHVSNFVIAKALQSMGVGEQFIANLGDTLTGEVPKEEAYEKYLKICAQFGYNVDNIFMASELYSPEVDNLLKPGEGKYENTLVFQVGDEKIVGKKSDGKGTYFYHDVVLANKLGGGTLYLTGLEQTEHFKLLQQMFPYVKHLPLGLVTLNGKKMSSREGNIISFDEVLKLFGEQFDSDELVWNVLAGYILKSKTEVIKNIDLNQLKNPKESQGLYLSYTLAKLKSATLEVQEQEEFSNFSMKFAYLKAMYNMQPSILFDALVKTAKKLSNLYDEHKIKGHEENKKLFKPYADDLLTGMKKLGLYNIEKV